MYEGKRMNHKSSAGAKRKLALMVSLVLLLAVGMGATIAWLADSTDDVQNTFTPASVPPGIDEDFEDNVKSNVSVTNNGNVSAYIRVAIVATWQDAQGNIAPNAPVLGTDYSMTLKTVVEDAEKNKWSGETGGYYYYLEPVAAGGTTDTLIVEAKPLVSNGDYHLVIEILTQTIQSEGTDTKGNKPIELAWGVDIENGQLKTATIVE